MNRDERFREESGKQITSDYERFCTGIEWKGQVRLLFLRFDLLFSFDRTATMFFFARHLKERMITDIKIATKIPKFQMEKVKLKKAAERVLKEKLADQQTSFEIALNAIKSGDALRSLRAIKPKQE